MRKGRCKLQWIATNIFILFGLIFIIIELELIKKEINTIKKQTQKGKGFFRIQPLRLSPLLFVTNIRHRYRCRSLLEFMFNYYKIHFVPWYFESKFWTILQVSAMGQIHMELIRMYACLTILTNLTLVSVGLN